MRNLLIAIPIILAFIESGCKQQGKTQVEAKQTEEKNISHSKASGMEWMELNNEWVPVIRKVDKLLHSGKKAYDRKDYKESAGKMEEAYVILKNKVQKNITRKELLNTSESLKALSKKIAEGNTSKEEVDSVLYKVCDVSMKNCWVLINKEDDLWVPVEELQIHLDSTYFYFTKNDTLKSQEELAKAFWLINADSKKYCSPRGETISDKIRAEMIAISHALKKGEQATVGKIKVNIAKTYFLKADNHYASASQLSLNYDNDRLEGSDDLGLEIKATAFYLEKALNTQGIKPSEKESFELENALLLGNELLGGYAHPKEEITESINDIGRIMLRYRHIFYPQAI